MMRLDIFITLTLLILQIEYMKNIISNFLAFSFAVFPVECFCHIPFTIENFHWGKIEIISVDKEKINKSELSHSFPAKIYNTQANDTSMLKSFQWCEGDLKKIFPLHQISCSVHINSEKKELNLVVGLSRSNTVVSDNHITDKPPLVLLNYHLIHAYNQFDAKLNSFKDMDLEILEMARYTKNQEYYKGFSNPELDKEAKKLYEVIAPLKKHVFKVIEQSTDKEDLEAAFKLLPWVGLTTKDSQWLFNQLKKHSSAEIKSRIIVLLPPLHTSLNKETEEKLIAAILPLIKNIDGTLRAESLEIIRKLIEKKPSCKKYIDSETKDYITYLYNNSVLEEIRIPTKKIIYHLG